MAPVREVSPVQQSPPAVGFAGLGPGDVLVDLSTIAPDESRAGWLDAAGHAIPGPDDACDEP